MANFPYRLDKRLIVIPVTLYGKHGYLMSEFVLDTGASFSIIDHSLAFSLGYSPREGTGVSSIRSAVGKETGYRLTIEGVEALGKKFEKVEIACHDLKEQGVEGLIGMPFLERFEWCLHPQKQMISV